MNERPQDMQELVHEDTQGLHFGKWVILPPLQIGIDLSEVLIEPDHAQAGEKEHRAQAGATLMRHGGLAALFLARDVGGRLDPGQLDPLSSCLVTFGIAHFRQKDGCGNSLQGFYREQVGSFRESGQTGGHGIGHPFELFLEGL